MRWHVQTHVGQQRRKARTAREKEQRGLARLERIRRVQQERIFEGTGENRKDENDAWLRVPDPFIRRDSALLGT